MFTYGQAEAVLASLHGATGPAMQKAFRGRLKHLKRLGIPRGINPGRGAKVWYEDAQLFEWAFCLELAELGLDPTFVVGLMEEHWDQSILPEFMRAQKKMNVGPDTYFIAYPKIMAATWATPRAESAFPFEFKKFEHAAHVGVWIGRNRRSVLINISSLVKEMALTRVLADSARAGSRTKPTGV